MGSMSISDAIKQVLESNGWKQRINEIRLRKEWETIVGKTIAKYTSEIHLRNGTLTVTASVPALKHELRFAKDNLKQNINEYFKDNIVFEIIIK